MLRILTTAMVATGLLAGQALADGWSKLVDPAGLAALVEEGDAVVLDIRSPKDYAAGHVETAVNVPYHAWRGPDENPGALIDDGKVTLLLSEAGIARDTPVVVTYRGEDASDFGAAARVYWTLKSAGVERIAILNGGLEAWRAAGMELSRGEWANIPSDETFAVSDAWKIDREGVAAVIAGGRDAILVDARPDAFFRGVKKHEAAAEAGTLSGAVNLLHERFFASKGRMVEDREAVLALARAAGWTPGAEVVSFCNTGHWAATNWFALSEIGGIEGVKLYPESLVGWTRSDRLVGV